MLRYEFSHRLGFHLIVSTHCILPRVRMHVSSKHNCRFNYQSVKASLNSSADQNSLPPFFVLDPFDLADD